VESNGSACRRFRVLVVCMSKPQAGAQCAVSSMAHPTLPAPGAKLAAAQLHSQSLACHMWGVVYLLYLLACALQYRYLNNMPCHMPCLTVPLLFAFKTYVVCSM
jgi:hypothetical protein